MKTIVIGICLSFWMVLSLALVCSIIGMLLFIPKDEYIYKDSVPSTWMTIGKSLLDYLIKS